MNTLKMDAFDSFHHGWALLTAGVPGDYNTMTISWGSVGCLWSRSVATVYVRPSRYTYEFMEKYDTFTVSFYPGEYRPALAILGRESGRDGDKVAKAGLTPVVFGDGVTFAEASCTLLCRKIYFQDMNPEQIQEDIREQYYPEGETVHRLYIGQVLDVREAKDGAGA